MTDIEKVLTEVREALENIRKDMHRQDCCLKDYDVAPGGHECSCPQEWAAAALAAFTADMPGAIGVCVNHAKTMRDAFAGPQRAHLDDFNVVREAVAKLEGE